MMNFPTAIRFRDITVVASLSHLTDIKNNFKAFPSTGKRKQTTLDRQVNLNSRKDDDSENIPSYDTHSEGYSYTASVFIPNLSAVCKYADSLNSGPPLAKKTNT